MSSSPPICDDCRDVRCDCSAPRIFMRVTSGSPLEPEAVSEATDSDLGAGLVAGDERCLEEAYRRWSPVIAIPNR